ncbi:MAG TPA: OmpH family outer membrane protein [Arenicellales bacterium]|nr:OmpH family outer membrane protein [Arenicellales bacterium]
MVCSAGSAGFNALRAAGLAVVLSVFTAVEAFAQENPNYAFVNISQVIAQSEEGRAEAAKLESLGAEKEQELNERRQQLEELVQEYEESVNAGDRDTELRDRIERTRRELERDIQQAQSDVDSSRQDRIQVIGNKVVKLVREFAQSNGYTAILRSDGGQTVYVDPAEDITDRIIEAYNEAYPAE